METSSSIQTVIGVKRYIMAVDNIITMELVVRASPATDRAGIPFGQNALLGDCIPLLGVARSVM